MVVTLTLNPALDKSFTVDSLLPEKKMRGTDLRVDAGGGGINVSRGVHELGGRTLALFPSAGCNGQRLVAELDSLGIALHTVQGAAETRESISVLEKAGGRQYRFVLPGNPPGTTALEELLRYGFPGGAETLVISGSMPPGTPPGYLERWVAKGRGAGLRVLGDSSGAALQELLEAGAHIVKPSLSELAALSGQDCRNPTAIEATAKEWIERYGTEAVVVSLGASGAMLVSREVTCRLAAPPVQLKSSVGAGDSMVAGIAWMLDEGASLRSAVALGVACGTAATLQDGTQLFARADAFRYYQWVLENSDPLPLATADTVRPQ